MFVSSSGGNAGLSVAYSGRVLGIPTTVILPETTSKKMLELIKEEGANVVVHGKVWDDANQYALDIVSKNPSYTYIHPFDDPVIWSGHSTIIDEIKEEIPKPDVIITVVGGGGLLCGIVEGLEKNGWKDVPIIASETIGAESFYKSVKAGKLITLDGITSIARTLGAKRVCEKVFEYSQKYPIIPVTVSDENAMNACVRFSNETRFLIEPSCGAGAAVIYEKLPELTEIIKDKKDPVIVLIVCGGNAVYYEDKK